MVHLNVAKASHNCCSVICLFPMEETRSRGWGVGTIGLVSKGANE